jgi:hypothetical protein
VFRYARFLLLWLCLAAVWPSLPAAQAAPALQTAETFTAPQFLNTDILELQGLIGDAEAWTIGGGYLYWSNCSTNPYLRRWPIDGGQVVTIPGAGVCASDLWAANETGLFYVRQEGSASNLYRRAANAPAVAALVVSANAPIVSMAIDADFVYLLGATDSISYGLFRVATTATNGQLQLLDNAGSDAKNLVVTKFTLFWFADSQLFSRNKDCLNQCVQILGAESDGRSLNSFLYAIGIGLNGPVWVKDSKVRAFVRPRAAPLCPEEPGVSCGTIEDIYTAPADNREPNNTYRHLPRHLSTDGTYLYWVEEHQRLNGSGVYQPTTEGRLMVWNPAIPFVRPPFPEPILFFRAPTAIACQNCNGNYNISSAPTAAANGAVFFQTSRGLARVRLKTPYIADLELTQIEVTQGLQNLNNELPLIANKPTFVQVYGRQLVVFASLEPQRQAKVLLYGKNAAGDSLPGSPLQPLYRSLQNATLNRDNPRRFSLLIPTLFQLPPAWTRVENLKLTAVIESEPNDVDPNPSNNTRDIIVSFTTMKPLCLVAVPVRTSARDALHTDPGYLRQVDTLRALFPVGNVWDFHQDAPLIKSTSADGTATPFDLPTDSDQLLNALWWRSVFSDDPRPCVAAGATTHYVGLLPADAPTSNEAGFSYLNSNLIATKLITPSLWAARNYQHGAFASLARHLGHAYGLRHINCGGAPNPDLAYPYANPCMIDDRPEFEQSTYFGFDQHTLQVLTPRHFRDFMSFGAPFWISDYTFRALVNSIQARSLLPMTTAPLSTIFLSGSLAADGSTGSLDPAWVLPNSRGFASMSSAATATSAPVNATIRLFDASGAELGRRPVTTRSNATQTLQRFHLSLPAPVEKIAKIELRNNEQLLATLQSGSTTPIVEVLSPVGGETVSNTLTLSWQTSDTDPRDTLLTTVQYSADNGQTWQALLTNLPSSSALQTQTVTLTNISSLPGETASGRVRVLVSDGLHTAFATSTPFNVTNRAPEPQINLPAPGETLPVGGRLILRGSAVDSEEGVLSDAALRWRIDGMSAGVGLNITVAGLAPGSHTATLTARDSDGAERSINTPFNIQPLMVPQQPLNEQSIALADPCNELGYQQAVTLPLSALDTAEQATVRLIRSQTHLWACFSGMQRDTAGSEATLRFDLNLGREASPQTNTLIYRFRDDGTISIQRGAAAPAVPALDTVNSYVHATPTIWSVHVRIAPSALGNLSQDFGLMAQYSRGMGLNNRIQWPQTAAIDQPRTWALTTFGRLTFLPWLSS